MVKHLQHLGYVSSKWRKTISLSEAFLVHTRFEMVKELVRRTLAPWMKEVREFGECLTKGEHVSQKGAQAQFQQHNPALFSSYNKHSPEFLFIGQEVAKKQLDPV